MKLLCAIGIHRYKEEALPVTKSEHGGHLALGCDVCANCGKIRKAHKDHLLEMRAWGGLTSEDFLV